MEIGPAKIILTRDAVIRHRELCVELFGGRAPAVRSGSAVAAGRVRGLEMSRKPRGLAMRGTSAVSTIVNVRDFAGGVEPCARFYHGAWGTGHDDDYPYFLDAFLHSSLTPTAIPRFYVLAIEDRIIGCYGIVTMDWVSRQDLHPWFAGLFVAERFRGHDYGRLLLTHAADEARRMGLPTLYLTTDHHGYYERCGWERIEDGYDMKGRPARIYRLAVA